MKLKTGRRAIAAGLGLMVFAAGLHAFCRASERDKFVRVFFPRGGSIMAELAVTEAERARGLMFREKVQADQGMLFVFEEEGIQSFWMKNTLVPLDILWLGRDRRVIYIAADVPPCEADPCPSYGPNIPVAFVLELKAGECRVRGIQPGDRLEFVL